MNWDAAGVLSNIILVTALVAVTAWYARKVSKQTELMVQDRERNKILEEVQEVLTPTIKRLEKEIEAIEHNKIKWIRNPTGMCFFEGYPSKLLCTGIKACSSAERDVFNKFPDLNEKFSSHDALYDKLYAAYATIEREVKTPELKERLKVLVKKFNESREGSNRLNGVPFEKPDIIFGNFIINREYEIERSPNSVQPNIDFWEAYRDELLKFREKPQVDKLDKEIEGLLRQLKELDEELLDALEKIREEYRVKYNFTKYEIDPELKKLENPLGIDLI
ncbi:MAG: hypothetical protein JW878_09085 [Methanomicrobia archaeon]|nr:hypothetical protein [Methanomicrobia archaeon]